VVETPPPAAGPSVGSPVGHIPPHGERAAGRMGDEAGPRADIAILRGNRSLVAITIDRRGGDVEVVVNPADRVLTQPRVETGSSAALS